MAQPTKRRVALVQYPPSQAFVLASLLPAIANELPGWKVVTTRDELDAGEVPDLQWSDYDELDWDSGLEEGRIANSYVIRKGLIRKNHLAHTISLYLSKNPASPLRQATLRTFIFNLSFPDELDELLQDDLYELAEAFREDEGKDAAGAKWWILKAALADKGNGIRLFSNREMLEEIFEEFDVDSEEEEEEESGSEDEGGESSVAPRSFGADTKVDSSQMREWVIQEYISSPLLLDPVASSDSTPRKFHLRVYVLAVGGLSVYVHHPYLALFAPTPYEHPTLSPTGAVDLSSHLTNTCLQTAPDAETREGQLAFAVETFQSLGERTVLEGPHKGTELGEERIREVEEKVCQTVRETFKAGVSAGSGFQVLPNCFEIFGVDLLVSDDFAVSLLEINACPDFTQTGVELQSVIDDLFAQTLQVAVVPFFTTPTADPAPEVDDLAAGVERTLKISGGLRQVLEMEVSRAW